MANFFITPKLRFPEFKSMWKLKKLSDVLKVSNETNSGGTYTKQQVLSVSGLFGIVNQIDFQGRSFAGVSIQNYHVVQRGDIVYTKSPLKTNPYGIIKANKGEAGVVSTLYAVYKPQPEFVASFADYYFQLSDNTNRYLRPLVNKGAKNDMKISDGDALKGRIYIPSRIEQEKIVMFLTVVDEKISALQKRKELLEKYKKGVMQAIFSQKIRFKDENGKDYPNWELKKVSEIFSEGHERYTDNLDLLSVTIGEGVKKRSEIKGKDNSSENKSNYKRVYRGDLVYNSMRMWQGASGVSDFNGVVSPAYTVLRANEGHYTYFYGCYFKWVKLVHIFERFSQGLTSDTWNLKYNQISSIRISVPTQIEQKKIADFLTSIDEKITLAEKKLEQVTKFKKALLQQMFV